MFEFLVNLYIYDGTEGITYMLGVVADVAVTENR